MTKKTQHVAMLITLFAATASFTDLLTSLELATLMTRLNDTNTTDSLEGKSSENPFKPDKLLENCDSIRNDFFSSICQLSTFSCRGKCVDNNTDCSCDMLCPVYGDCCWDFNSQCPLVAAASQSLYATLDGTVATCKNGNSFITGKRDNKNEQPGKTGDADLLQPAVTLSHEIHFVNSDVFKQINGGEQYDLKTQTWEKSIYIRETRDFSLDNLQEFVNSGKAGMIRGAEVVDVVDSRPGHRAFRQRQCVRRWRSSCKRQTTTRWCRLPVLFTIEDVRERCTSIAVNSTAQPLDKKVEIETNDDTDSVDIVMGIPSTPPAVVVQHSPIQRSSINYPKRSPISKPNDISSATKNLRCITVPGLPGLPKTQASETISKSTRVVFESLPELNIFVTLRTSSSPDVIVCNKTKNGDSGNRWKIYVVCKPGLLPVGLTCRRASKVTIQTYGSRNVQTHGSLIYHILSRLIVNYGTTFQPPSNWSSDNTVKDYPVNRMSVTNYLPVNENFLRYGGSKLPVTDFIVQGIKGEFMRRNLNSFRLKIVTICLLVRHESPGEQDWLTCDRLHFVANNTMDSIEHFGVAGSFIPEPPNAMTEDWVVTSSLATAGGMVGSHFLGRNYLLAHYWVLYFWFRFISFVSQ